ncbi:MAG: hypothetical protein ACRD09_00545 [Vicinamibacterales bacterium]
MLLVCLAPAAAPALELPVSVERLQRELAKPAPETPVKIPHVFRVTIEGRSMRFPAPWDPANDTVVPSYVRPQMSIDHYEFLMAVTPQEFRAGVLYKIAIPVLPAAAQVVDAIRAAIRRRQEERARREVDEALRQLLEARKKEAEKK